MTWTAPPWDGGTPITTYRVLRGNASGSETVLVDGEVAQTYVDTNVTPEATYYYQVVALNAIGGGPPSNEIPGTPGGLGQAVPGWVLVATVAAVIGVAALLGLWVLVRRRRRDEQPQQPAEPERPPR